MELSYSGKYYAPWACSNVTDAEAAEDMAMGEALVAVAEAHGGWIEHGEGTPCDVYFCAFFPLAEVKKYYRELYHCYQGP